MLDKPCFKLLLALSKAIGSGDSLSVSLNSFYKVCRIDVFLIFRVSIQPYDRWGFRQNLEGEDEEAFLSMSKKMDRRSEELRVNKSTENSILTVITNDALWSMRWCTNEQVRDQDLGRAFVCVVGPHTLLS